MKAPTRVADSADGRLVARRLRESRQQMALLRQWSPRHRVHTFRRTTTGNNGPLYVGDDPWYGGSNVYMDDVRLYSGALTDAEIKYLYGFVGYWKFAEGIGTTAADSSGVANTATLSGGSTWET